MVSQHTNWRRRLVEDLEALRAGKRVPWSRVGNHLDAAWSSDYWQSEGVRSFSRWIRDIARRCEYAESSLWRYLSAVREYRRVSGELRNLGIDVPPPEALPDFVSADNIELLSKLARVAPREVLSSLAIRTVRGEITRNELRQAWRTFRPALAGRTARGRARSRPRVNYSDPQQRESLREAEIVNALELSDGNWTGRTDLRSYRVIAHVRVESHSDEDDGIVFDAVTVIETAEGLLELHGLQCNGLPYLFESLLSEVVRAADFCDFFWLIGRQEDPRVDVNHLPASVGLAIVNGLQINVVREAAPTPRPVRYREAMLETLMMRTLSR